MTSASMAIGFPPTVRIGDGVIRGYPASGAGSR